MEEVDYSKVPPEEWMFAIVGKFEKIFHRAFRGLRYKIVSRSSLLFDDTSKYYSDSLKY